ncbi:MAG: DUF3822 family protein [Flavobacteriaceae bacterium]
MLVQMETGQQFLMHLSNKHKTSQDLSILIHKDGFSFCTQTQHHFFSVEKDFPSAEALQSWMSYHQLDQSELQIIFCDSPAVTVPLSLFDESQPEHYIKSAISIQKDSHLVSKILNSTQQVVVFPVLAPFNDLLLSLFKTVPSSHIVAELLPALSAHSFGKGKKNMFIHLRKDTFDLFLYQGGQLLLQNSFPHKNSDDFLYYLFYVAEQFYLKPDQFDLYFLGRFTVFEDYYSGTKEFHHAIEFMAPHHPLLDTNHPVPFFQDFIGP